MTSVRVFGRAKKNRLSDKQQVLLLINETIAKLDNAKKTFGNLKNNVMPTLERCIQMLEFCRCELNMLLSMRDLQAQAEFYGRATQLLYEIIDTMQKMNYFYTYIDTMIEPRINELKKLIEEACRSMY